MTSCPCPKSVRQGCSSFLKRLTPNFLPFPKVWPDQRCVSNILPTLNEQEPTKSRRSLDHSPHCVACVGKMFIKCSYLFGAPPCDSRLTNKATALRGAIRLYTLLITGKSAPPTLFLASGNRPPSPDRQGKSSPHCDTRFRVKRSFHGSPYFWAKNNYPQNLSRLLVFSAMLAGASKTSCQARTVFQRGQCRSWPL